MKKALILVLVLVLCPAPAVAAGCGWDQASGWVQRENLKKGDASWDLNVPLRFSADFSRRKKVPRIEGYLNATSATCGDTILLKTVGSKQFEVEIYRMGYYKNTGARLVSSLDSPKTIQIDSKMPPGQYLVKLISKNRQTSFIPLVVKGNAPGDLTFVSSVMTWQAYNQWGGSSLYKGADGSRESKSDVVSFERPYDGDGSGQFRFMEQPLITMAEQLGLDINYVTDVDVDQNVNIFQNSNSIVLGGHSEFWTTTMRQRYDDALAQGKNLIVFGGNTAYAFTALSGKELKGRIPYRDMKNPESLLLGSQFFALGIRKDLISNNVWPFSVLGKDATIKGIYGYEADTAMGTVGPGVQVLARAAISPTEKGFVAMSTYYKAPSGAAVMNMGTNGWVCAISNRCPWGHFFDVQAQKQIQKVTQEVLKAVKTAKWPVAQIDIPARP